MKKALVLSVLALAVMSSCKKDRTCHCRTVYDMYDNTTNTKLANFIPEDQDITMKDVSRKTAFNACVHKKEVTVSGTVRTEIDYYCELK